MILALLNKYVNTMFVFNYGTIVGKGLFCSARIVNLLIVQWKKQISLVLIAKMFLMKSVIHLLVRYKKGALVSVVQL